MKLIKKGEEVYLAIPINFILNKENIFVLMDSFENQLEFIHQKIKESLNDATLHTATA
jgi:hypothetical protein